MPFPVRESTSRPTVKALEAQIMAPSADAVACRLATAVSRGDEAAFQALYDRYHERLLRLALVLGRGDETLAQETVQAVFVTAAAKVRSVQSEEHLWNWLARVARQKLAKAWRRQQRESAVLVPGDLSECADIAEPDSALEESLDMALLELESDERQVIEWFYFDGLSHKEIADHLSTTPKAVSSRLERLRARLRALLVSRLSHET